MKIAILTTETPHHAQFVRALRGTCEDLVVFCETGAGPTPAFETHHPFEDVRDAYEWDLWFEGRRTPIAELAPVQTVPSMNSAHAVDALRRAQPDWIIVFGTGMIKQPVLEFFGGRIFNLHGGDPEDYRGLDTHLWAVWHRDFSGLTTTLHHLDVGLDTGAIVARERIALRPGMKLHELRAANTEACVSLTLDLAARNGIAPGRAQCRKGRYYSAMPATLKSLCLSRFEKFTSGLPS
jgi:hypothetical protein